MSTDPTDLPLPDEVLNHKAVARGWVTEDHVRQLAAPLIAAELRHWASRVDGYEGWQMYNRAEELQGLAHAQPRRQPGEPVSTEPDITTSDLPIPESARAAYDEVTVSLLLVAKGLRAPGPATWEDNVRAIAAPMIAAELRRMAEIIGPQRGIDDGSDFMVRNGCAADLLRRADDLDRSQGGDRQ